MREQFITKRFKPESLEIIKAANIILQEFADDGLVLTLRQLYYQFVSKGLLANKDSNYKRLGGIISNARLAGLVDWSMMEDRMRSSEGVTTWGEPQEIINAVAEQYREDLWRDQSYRPEVWIEKDALVGVIERPCNELRVRYTACRGYVSQSAQYEASKRFLKTLRNRQVPVIFHLGDHDPSGMDMTRENREKIELLVGQPIKVVRLALNMDQVERYKPPPNPAKETDIRFAGYAAEYGDESWELDALEPRVIERLIRSAITPLINKKRWQAAKVNEAANRDRLRLVSNNWDAIVDDL